MYYTISVERQPGGFFFRIKDEEKVVEAQAYSQTLADGLKLVTDAIAASERAKSEILNEH